jgi:hypothetical protein
MQFSKANFTASMSALGQKQTFCAAVKNILIRSRGRRVAASNSLFWIRCENAILCRHYRVAREPAVATTWIKFGRLKCVGRGIISPLGLVSDCALNFLKCLFASRLITSRVSLLDFSHGFRNDLVRLRRYFPKLAFGGCN